MGFLNGPFEGVKHLLISLDDALKTPLVLALNWTGVVPPILKHPQSVVYRGGDRGPSVPPCSQPQIPVGVGVDTPCTRETGASARAIRVVLMHSLLIEGRFPTVGLSFPLEESVVVMLAIRGVPDADPENSGLISS